MVPARIASGFAAGVACRIRICVSVRPTSCLAIGGAGLCTAGNSLFEIAPAINPQKELAVLADNMPRRILAICAVRLRRFSLRVAAAALALGAALIVSLLGVVRRIGQLEVTADRRWPGGFAAGGDA